MSMSTKISGAVSKGGVWYVIFIYGLITDTISER